MQKFDLSEKEPFFTACGLQNLKILLEKLPCPLVVIDSKARVHYTNAAFERLYQCKFSNVVNNLLSQVMFLTDPKAISDPISEAFKGQPILNLEWEEEQYYEGRIFWRQGKISPLINQEGKVEYAVLTIIDITEQVRTEKKLRKTLEKFRLLFEKAPDAIIILKEDQIIGANPAWERILGYKLEEIYEKRIWEISPEFQEQGISSRKLAEEKFNKVLASNPQLFKWKYLSKNGSIKYTEVSLTSMVLTIPDQTTPLLQAIIRETSSGQ